ncbi:hypothetical protein FB451DRAFT_1376213, partial [Mycena latifolia]
MKLLSFVVLCFAGSVLSGNTSSLLKLTASISSLGDQVSQLGSTLRVLPPFVINSTVPLGLYSAAEGLIPSLDYASDALQAHGTFSKEDADAVFLEVKKIEPVIHAMIQGVFDKRDVLAEFSVEEIPLHVFSSLQMLGPVAQRFLRALGATMKEGTGSYAELFSHAGETYHTLASAVLGLHYRRDAACHGSRNSIIGSWCPLTSPKSKPKQTRNAHKTYLRRTVQRKAMVANQHKGLARLLRFTSIVVSTLSDASDGSNVPYVRAITGATLSVLETAQSVKIYKTQCIVMLERLHMFLCILVQLTIQSINSCLAEQQNGGPLRRFLRNAEVSTRIQECMVRLDAAIEDFRVNFISVVGNTVKEMQADLVGRQQQIIELIQHDTDSEAGSSAQPFDRIKVGISGAISLLPGRPQIFHGRETQLETLVAMCISAPARVSILGAGGVGKTSLSLALLHDPQITRAFSERYFVSYLLVTMAAYLDIPPDNQLRQSILRRLSGGEPCMLVLDNLDTAWENIQASRKEIEDFLGLLTDIPHVALVVTMRGLERPGGIRWTRPFLPPLEPLDDAAARQIYLDIAGDPVDDLEEAQVHELLSLTDNLPLAITLLASTASFEGAAATLERYRLENTAMLSEGHEKRSNLNKSIMLSLCGWRLRAVPDAIALLSVLALLPDGASASDLLRCEKDIWDVGRCKSTLIRTALAFVRSDGRLRVLAPIREYMQKFHPPPGAVVMAWRTHLGGLLREWNGHRELVSTQLAENITANLGNIRSLVQYSFSNEQAEMQAIGREILELDAFLYDVYRGCTDLFSRVPEIIERTGDESLEGLRICALLERRISKIQKSEAEALMRMGIHIFTNASDPVGEGDWLYVVATLKLTVERPAQLYNAAAEYYSRACDAEETKRLNELALSLPDSGDLQRFKALLRGCRLRRLAGNHRDGVRLAVEAQTIARRLGNLKLQSRALWIQALLCVPSGQLSRALRLCEKARSLLVACGLQDSTGELGIIDLEAFVHLQRMDYVQSKEAHARIMRVASQGRFEMFYVHSLMNTIHIDVLLGHATGVLLERLDTATAHAQRNAFTHAVWYCDLVRAEVKHRDKDGRGAVKDYKRCLELFRGTEASGVGVCLEYLTDVYLEEQDFDEAFRWAVVYLAQSRQTGIVETLQSLRRIGDVFLANGDENTASNLYTVGLEAFTDIGVHCGRAECMARLGAISSRRDEAKTRWLALASPQEKMPRIRVHLFVLVRNSPGCADRKASAVPYSSRPFTIISPLFPQNPHRSTLLFPGDDADINLILFCIDSEERVLSAIKSHRAVRNDAIRALANLISRTVSSARQLR